MVTRAYKLGKAFGINPDNLIPQSIRHQIWRHPCPHIDQPKWIQWIFGKTWDIEVQRLLNYDDLEDHQFRIISNQYPIDEHLHVHESWFPFLDDQQVGLATILNLYPRQDLYYLDEHEIEHHINSPNPIQYLISNHIDSIFTSDEIREIGEHSKILAPRRLRNLIENPDLVNNN